jgi:hypothetical protein
MDAGGNDDSVMRLLAFHAPAVLEPHREWLAQQELRVVADRDVWVTAAVGPAIHIVTPPGYADLHCGVPTPTWLPSYGRRLATSRFGGALAAACGMCGQRLHLLLELRSIPPQFRLSVERLTIATCLSCLGWEHDELWFRHGVDGTVCMLDDKGQYHDPQFPVGPLMPTTAELVDFGPRYARQSWRTSIYENLNRLGGAPSWGQDEVVLECCECAAAMRHLLQVDSCFPLADSGRTFLFGSSGIAYVQWCDACRLSIHFWQST